MAQLISPRPLRSSVARFCLSPLNHTASTSRHARHLFGPAVHHKVSIDPAPLSKFFLPHPRADSARQHSISIETKLQNTPILTALREAPDSGDWYETRSYIALSEEHRTSLLTAGPLSGPGRLAVPPLIRAKTDESEAFVFAHLGKNLCGHTGIVHGGLLATLMDEALGRQAIMNLPDKVGVTASIKLDFKAPTRADQIIVVHTRTAPLEDSGSSNSSPSTSQSHKVKVTGSIYDKDRSLLVFASAIFVQPRDATPLLHGREKLLDFLGRRPACVEEHIFSTHTHH